MWMGRAGVNIRVMLGKYKMFGQDLDVRLRFKCQTKVRM